MMVLSLETPNLTNFVVTLSQSGKQRWSMESFAFNNERARLGYDLVFAKTLTIFGWTTGVITPEDTIKKA